MATSTPVPPFANPPPLPRPLVVLLSATELNDSNNYPAPAALLAHEDVTSKKWHGIHRHATRVHASLNRYQPYPVSRAPTPRVLHAPTPRLESSPLSSPELSETEEEEIEYYGDNDGKQSDEEEDGIGICGRRRNTAIAGMTTIKIPEKVKIPRPKGAGRMPIRELRLNFEPFNVDDIKVCRHRHPLCSPIIG
jgi:hypothetical protein